MNTYHQRFHPSEALTVFKKKVLFCNFPEHFFLHTKPPTALFWVSAVTKCGADLWRWWQPSLETAALQKRTPLMTFDKWWCLYPGQTSKLCTLRMHPSTSTHFLPRFALTFCICLLLCTRVRKSKNFPDSKISTAKTFRIKCVNRNVDDFATNARKT